MRAGVGKKAELGSPAMSQHVCARRILLEQQEKADACWNESFMHIHKLKSRGKLYQNGVLEEIKGMFPEAVQ